MKLYGKVRNINEEYREVQYTEYREDGTIKGKGTEDFSPERFRKLKYFEIFQKTGKQNKGGHDTWEQIGWFRCSGESRKAGKIARLIYGNDIQMRRIF